MLTILEGFLLKFSTGKMTKNENFTYTVKEIYNLYGMTYNWRKGFIKVYKNIFFLRWSGSVRDIPYPNM